MRRKPAFTALIDVLARKFIEIAKKSIELSEKDQAEKERSKKLREGSIDVEYRAVNEK